MNFDIQQFIKENWEYVVLIVGIICVVGAIKNWNWLCDSVGKPNSHLYGRRARRLIFFVLGCFAIAASMMSFFIK